MKVCVYGAGAVGAQLAMRLHRAGADVSAVMRGAHLDAARRDGLRVIAADTDWRERLPVSDDAADLGEQECVVVAVKQPSLASVAAGIAPLLGADTTVAFVGNGLPWWYFHRHGGPHDGRRLENLDPGGAVWDAVDPERVIGGVIYSAGEIAGPGVVRVANPNGRFILGEPDGSDSARVNALADAVRAGGLETTVSRAIRDDVWTKIINNMVSGPLAIATQSSLCDIWLDPACVRAAHAIVAEMTATARALGARPAAEADREVARGLPLKRKPSVLQELEAGRPIEIEALFDSPLELARLAGIETPVSDLIAAVARLRSRAAGSC